MGADLMDDYEANLCARPAPSGRVGALRRPRRRGRSARAWQLRLPSSRRCGTPTRWMA